MKFVPANADMPLCAEIGRGFQPGEMALPRADIGLIVGDQLFKFAGQQPGDRRPAPDGQQLDLQKGILGQGEGDVLGFHERSHVNQCSTRMRERQWGYGDHAPLVFFLREL